MNWKTVAWFFDDQILQSEFDAGGYRVNQISGVMVNVPQFLTDSHIIEGKRVKCSLVLMLKNHHMINF